VKPSLLTIARRALAGEAALAAGSHVVVAVSGGPDSMALLDVLARLAPEAGLTLSAHGVDHGLRQGAAAELDLAEAHAAKLGVPWSRTEVDVAHGGNLQARARAARWASLVTAARAWKRPAIATGHHAADRAETVLLRILRGSGLRGLGVLPPRALAPGAADVAVIRPLLRAERPAILAHLERHRVAFARDPSNDDPRFLRTRVRAALLPLLTELDAGIVHHLADLADEIARLGSEDGQDANGNSASWWRAAGLPRATQTAIAGLLRSRSRTVRVWMPGGLVLSAEGSGRGAQSPTSSTKSATARLPRRSPSG
jgi:tRNA(Ile)-lysidine synthase